MKKIVFVLAIAAVAGCATATQIDELNFRINELEKRLSRIEGDLYKVEVKSASPVAKVAEPKLEPVKEVEQSVIDTKINSFLREYLGVAFGDSIDKYPTAIENNDYLYQKCRVVTVLKKFQYFDKALAYFSDGKLYAVSFFADIDEKYSIDSTNERINQTRADLAVTLGLASDAFMNGSGDPLRLLRLRRQLRTGMRDDSHRATTRYTLGDCNSFFIRAPDGFRRIGVTISDGNLLRKIDSDKNARGEQLPEMK